MERNFTNENFESFLKQNADRNRMRPSDKVWNNISKSLNKRRRYTIGLTSFLLITSLLGYLVIQQPIQPVQNRITLPKANAEVIKQANVAQKKSQLTAYHKPQPFSASQVIAEQRPLFSPGLNNIIPEFAYENMVPGNLNFQNTIIDSDPEAALMTEDKKQQNPLKENDLLTIESVINSYKQGKKKRFSFQFYFTPTVSYRKLSENKSYLRSGNNVFSNYPVLQNDVNNMVTHKPDMGFEVGFTSKYALTNKLKLRAGLQLNVNRYAIKTFRSSTEMATITLNNTGRRPDSVLMASNYNNFNGYKTNWLQNYYLQVSSPIGVEYTFAGNKNIQFGVASTIQPTYLLGDRAYMISSDYKNYVEVPWLVRKWNVNTNLETFVSYSTGKMNWQVGPQVRYQLLSSFISKYPVKENLFDFGLKVGVSLNK